MAEAEVAMTDAPETTAPVESVPAPETTSAAAPQAAATAPAPATTGAAAPAPVPAAPQAVVEKAAAPAADADTLLSMDRQQLAEFTASHERGLQQGRRNDEADECAAGRAGNAQG